MTDQLSSKLANDSSFTEITELQAILKAPMPDHWDNEAAWDAIRRGNFQLAIIRLFGTNELIQNLGWLEHTNDWDWRASLTFREGVEARTEYDCGTYIVALIDSEGTEYTNLTELSERWTRARPIEFLVLDAAWYENEEDEAPHEDRVTVPIWDLDSISLDYDT